MLGKGLESLIPPQSDSVDDNGSAAAGDGQGFSGAGPTPISGDSVSALPPIPKEDNRPPPVFLSQSRGGGSKPDKKSAQDFIFHIEVEKIKPNPNQPRRNFDEQGLRELAYSVREFGFLQPLVVSKIEKETPTGVDVEYQLIAGERRLMAAKMLGLPVVPVIVRNVGLEREKLELAVIENIQRENLNPIETARAFERLQEEFRMTQREIAAKLGKSREVVANTVRLLSLPTDIQQALEKGQITESHARLLLAIEDPGAQKNLFDDIVQNHLTTREVKHRVQSTKTRSVHRTEELPPEIRMMEDKLSAELGTPVKIERVSPRGEAGTGTGKIVIAFYSEEELENIVSKIGKEGV